jgi:hypothetical protein
MELGFWVIIGGWVAAGLTLFMFSFLYRDNPFFRFGEHLYVGISIGYLITLTIYEVIIKKWWDPVFKDEKLWLMIPAILGIFVVLRIFPRLAWLSRLSFAFMMGYSAGLAIPRLITSNLLRQIEGTIQPILRVKEGVIDLSAPALLADFTTLVIFVGVFTVLIYFFFSIEHRGPLRIGSRIGIMFLMIWLGATYGNTVMGRLSLLKGRFSDLLEYGSASYYYATPFLLGIIIIGLILYTLAGRRAG